MCRRVMSTASPISLPRSPGDHRPLLRHTVVDSSLAGRRRHSDTAAPCHQLGPGAHELAERITPQTAGWVHPRRRLAGLSKRSAKRGDASPNAMVTSCKGGRSHQAALVHMRTEAANWCAASLMASMFQQAWHRSKDPRNASRVTRRWLGLRTPQDHRKPRFHTRRWRTPFDRR